MASSVVLIGEPLLELSHPCGESARLGFGGDAFNTAVYLARLGHAPYLVSAVGTDPYSDGIVDRCRREGVRTDHLLRHPHRLPGLYTIRTGPEGERHFYYWRDNSAARACFELPAWEQHLAFAASAGWLYLTGITLSIFREDERAKLGAVAREVRRRGGEVVFDTNYRPNGWVSAEHANAAIAAIAPEVTLAMPTRDDEDLLHGSAPASVHAERWRSGGAREAVVKCGAEGALVHAADGTVTLIAGEPEIEAVDTTGAGDSFNAAYISARIAGLPPVQAARAANRLAAEVVRHPGAIVPDAVMPDSVGDQ